MGALCQLFWKIMYIFGRVIERKLVKVSLKRFCLIISKIHMILQL